jgi:anaerobic selenocysteine-containing dehydrogenase
MNMTDKLLLNTHRGAPFVFLNDREAAELGIRNGARVRLTSDVGQVLLEAKLTPSCRPGQAILYNGFEPLMHEGWQSQADLEPGQMKWLGLASGYGHLRYRVFGWQAIPTDRAVRVDVEPAD